MEELFSNALKSVKSNRVLYTASFFARSSLLYLQEIGQLTALKAHTSRRTGLSSYLCFLVEVGSGTLEYKGQKYTLQVGDMVFIDCLKPYVHESSEDDLWTLRKSTKNTLNEVVNRSLKHQKQISMLTC